MGRSGRRRGLSHGPRLLRPNPPCGPRSPGSASVPRRAILRPNSPSYPTSRGPTNPVGTNHDGHYREPQPPQHAPDEEVEPGATRPNCAESNPGDDQITRRSRKRRRWQRFTSNERATPCPHAAPAHGPPEAPRSPAGRFCSQIRPRTQPLGDQPTPKGPPVAEASGGEPDHNVRRAEHGGTRGDGHNTAPHSTRSMGLVLAHPANGVCNSAV